MNTIDEKGDILTYTNIIERSISEISDDVVTRIGANAFLGCFNLTTVNFSQVTQIDYSAFCNCSNLTTINFPVLENIGSYAFMSCYNLTSINLSKIICV